MREIKFRAFDKDTKQMIKDFSVRSDGFVEVLEGDGRSGKFMRQDFLLMQYTGLKDKNGVEIYEGDILRSPSMPDSPVEYQRGSFNGVYADGSYDEWEAPLWRYTVEVIGNIYENPELLKKEAAK